MHIIRTFYIYVRKDVRIRSPLPPPPKPNGLRQRKYFGKHCYRMFRKFNEFLYYSWDEPMNMRNRKYEPE